VTSQTFTSSLISFAGVGEASNNSLIVTVAWGGPNAECISSLKQARQR